MSLTRYHWPELSLTEQQRVLLRPAISDTTALRRTVDDIIATVRSRGDAALRNYALQFDGVRLETLRVSQSEFDAAAEALSPIQRDAIEQAADNIRRFHAEQLPQPIAIDTRQGMRCERISQPLERVGLYVPAGTAPLPSAALMLSIPAAIAQCPVRVLCAPTNADGNIDPAILFAAQVGGVRDVFKAGGAQAIAAMAYGTESIPKVNKIFGPGNAYVTAAKAAVADDPLGAAQDMPAGPSEVLVIADAGAQPEDVAADLLSQAEHGKDSQVLLIALADAPIDAIVSATEEQLARLPRQHIAAAALANSAIITVESIDSAIEVSNLYAPEHLILNVEAARQYLPQIRNAGSVFLGPWTPESLGDYCSGTNHVLPTYGYANTFSGLGVDQFMRHMTVQEASAHGLQQIGPVAVTLAELEGLEAHAQAVRTRLARLTT